MTRKDGGMVSVLVDDSDCCICDMTHVEYCGRRFGMKLKQSIQQREQTRQPPLNKEQIPLD